MRGAGTDAKELARLVVNTDKLNELRKKFNIKTDVELADRIGVDVATLYRVTSGRTAPSNAFIARLKLAFPAVALDALFEVRTDSVAS